MRNAVWIPRVCLVASMAAMLAMGARAEAAGAPACPPPAPLIAPGVAGWAGPPSNDGSLGDGAVPSVPGDIFATIGIPAPTVPTPFSYTTVTSPYPDAAGCMAFNAPEVQGHTTEHNCLCTNCFTLMQQCDALPGCRAIWKCGADSGCNSASSCYLLPPSPCATVIDLWGNAGVSTALTQLLETCGGAAGCPTM